MSVRARQTLVAITFAAVLAHPARALAAQGTVGPHYAQAACSGNAMVVAAPEIFSSPPRTTPGISIVGSQHNQVVAYKVNIFYSTDATSWQLSASSAWRAAWVGDSLNAPVGPGLWYDYDAGQWVSDTLSWTLNFKGYYRAAVQFYWFADAVSDAGADYVWADHFDYDTGFGGVLDYCAVS